LSYQSEDWTGLEPATSTFNGITVNKRLRNVVVSDENRIKGVIVKSDNLDAAAQLKCMIPDFLLRAI